MPSTSSRVAAALFLAAGALAGATIGTTAIASAVPEWDIERYDDCLRGKDLSDPSEKIAWTKKCCLDSGGVWNDSLGKCQSPPAQSAQRPGLETRPGVITQTLEPMPVLGHPGMITQTFEPVGVG
jgi:hypothetical protein